MVVINVTLELAQVLAVVELLVDFRDSGSRMHIVVVVLMVVMLMAILLILVMSMLPRVVHVTLLIGDGRCSHAIYGAEVMVTALRCKGTAAIA